MPNVLSYGCAFVLILATVPARSLAQQPDPYYPLPRAANIPVVSLPYPAQAVSYMEPSADDRNGNVPAAPLSVRAQGPYNYQTEIVRPIPMTAGDPNPLRAVSQPWIADPAERLAQNSVGPEIIRPGIPAIQVPLPSGAGSAGVSPAGAQPSEAARAMQGIGSPFDPSQFRLPTLGLPPGLGTPEPTAETKREFGQFVEREIAPENTIQVVVGRAKVLVLREKPRRIYAPDENIAGIQVVTDMEISVVGKKQGTTVLNLWFPDPRDPNNPQRDRTLSYMVVVLADPERAALEVLAERRRLEAQVKAFEQALKVLEREIKEAFPESAVHLSLVGEQVVVRGEAKDAVEAAQILRIVAQHSPTQRRTRVDSSKNVNVNFIPGLGDEQAAVDAIRQILEGNANLVNLLRIPGEQQVMLMVTVAEVDRTAARTIGMDFSITKGGLAFAQNTGQGLNIGTATAGTVTGTTGISAAAQALRDVGGNLPTAVDNGNVLMAIQALRTLNFARSLAEPNLTVINGRTASLLAGGSFPIPNSIVLPGGAAQSVTYQTFGVALQFTPFITDRDRIRLQLNANVSTPSTTTTQVSGAAVPSQITQRQFNTVVELREGQTLTVAGLIQNNFSGQSNRVPFWGDLPLIGRTGGVDSLSSGEQELVVLVTPVLVHPLEQCQTPPLPGNNIFEPGDVEFYLGGQLESRRSQDYRASVRTDFARQKRYCDCNDLFIIGPQGTTYGCCKSGNCPCPPPAASSSSPAPVPESVPAPAPQNVQPPRP
ncbi:MAG: pilus assembly protein N-terminal domain-containing protein [Thermoguttaceae bacterium]